MRDRENAEATPATIVHRAHGAFGELLVLDANGRRHLRFGGVDGVDQTVIERRRPGSLPTIYLRVATVGAVLAPRLERILLIGLGGGAYARFLRRCFPQAAIDVVEVDPIVLRLARDYFEFCEGRRLRVFIEDAADFVADAAADEAWRYDFVFLDAYHGQKIPAPLARQSFFRNIASLLDEGGMAVANVGLPERWAEDRVLRRFAAGFAAGCFELSVPDEDNRIVVASGTRMPGARRLLERARAADDQRLLPFEVLPFLRHRRAWPTS